MEVLPTIRCATGADAASSSIRAELRLGRSTIFKVFPLPALAGGLSSALAAAGRSGDHPQHGPSIFGRDLPIGDTLQIQGEPIRRPETILWLRASPLACDAGHQRC